MSDVAADVAAGEKPMERDALTPTDSSVDEVQEGETVEEETPQNMWDELTREVGDDEVAEAEMDSPSPDEGEVTEPSQEERSVADPEEVEQQEVEAPQEERVEPEPEKSEVEAETAPVTTEQDTQPQEVDSSVDNRSFDERKAEWVKQLTPQFELSKEQVEQLVVEPEKAIPSMMADLYVRTIHTFGEMLPHFLPPISAELRPELCRYHEETVAGIADVYWKRHPKATFEKAARDIGIMSHYSLKIPVPAGSVPTPQTAPKPPAPSRGTSPRPAKTAPKLDEQQSYYASVVEEVEDD